MEKEMESLRENNVWELIELPLNRKVVGSKWIFKRKIDVNGSVEARLVAHGCDYEETFSPVVRFESIRYLVALAAQNKLQLDQMDVSEVYMKQPTQKHIWFAV